MTTSANPSLPSTHCSHERGHITDSFLFGNRYSSPQSRRIFCDVCRCQRWLTIEAELAQAEGELGIIPQDSADHIAATARVDRLDMAAVQAETNRTGHSLVGLLRVFQRACGEAGQFIHYGATTQDIQDTGQSLEIRDVLDELQPLLDAVIGRLADLAEAHARTIALGRTHAQPALPMGFGLKIASWVDELVRHRDRIREARPRIVVAEMFGGAGTMAGFGNQALSLLECFADRIGLGVPTIGWHSARDRVVEYVGILAMITGTLARIADEVRILSRPEFDELEEAWPRGKVGSSTMPHKRNPERCEQVVVMARLASAQMVAALSGMIGDHERDARALRVEWACVPDVAHHCLAACAMVLETVTGLRVHADQLQHNVHTVTEWIMSERLMLALGKHIGKQHAHEVVYELAQQARDQGCPMRALIEHRPDITDRLTSTQLAEIFDPDSYLGASPELTMRAVSEARKQIGAYA